MLDVALTHPTNLDEWRAHARELIARQIQPDAISWRVSGEAQDLFAQQTVGASGVASPLVVPRRFAELAGSIICHRHPARFSLLYQLLWRITRGERRLLVILSDPDVVRAEAMAKSVRRDLHKMKAFVRFRSTQENGAEHFIAWFEPRHFIVERVGPFFAQRFAGMLWSIMTPDRSAHWDGERLSFSPGTEKSEVPSEDALADVWRRYYASIFNPARMNLKAMKRQMPVRYWTNLPEADLIAPLAAGASRRTHAMLATHPDQWRQAARAISGEQSSGRHEIRNNLRINTKNGEG
jgi:DNA polymerase